MAGGAAAAGPGRAAGGASPRGVWGGSSAGELEPREGRASAGRRRGMRAGPSEKEAAKYRRRWCGEEFLSAYLLLRIPSKILSEKLAHHSERAAAV